MGGQITGRTRLPSHGVDALCEHNSGSNVAGDSSPGLALDARDILGTVVAG